jgi:hypothetical protein
MLCVEGISSVGRMVPMHHYGVIKLLPQSAESIAH